MQIEFPEGSRPQLGKFYLAAGPVNKLATILFVTTCLWNELLINEILLLV